MRPSRFCPVWVTVWVRRHTDSIFCPQIGFYRRQKRPCRLHLLGGVRLGNDEEIVVITALADIRKLGNQPGQAGIKHAGFDIPFPELGNDSAVVLHIYAVKRKNGAHRVENRIVCAVCRTAVAFACKQQLCVPQTFLCVVKANLGDFNSLFRKYSESPPSARSDKTAGNPHTAGTAPAAQRGQKP